MSKKESVNKEEKNSEEKSEGIKEKPEESEAEKLKKELSETKELLLRTAAEYDNFRKRSEREKTSIYGDATSKAVSAILPLADSLDAALNSSDTQSEEYKKGIELLQNQLKSCFSKLSVEPFGDVGDGFDPNLHNAISHVEEESEKQNFVSAVFQKGYKIGDKIIRHAMVQVTN
ncbi:MAG: nucleotide exchange factor GrpE [Clostridia bacterium]|nr:nucleotide exchange factor GrpE [Clostridia bacterium]